MMIGDKMPPSAIHQQRDTPERYAMIVFEDMIFTKQYLAGFRDKLIEKFRQISDGEADPPSASYEPKLSAQDLTQIIDFLRSSIQPNSIKPTPVENVRKYISHCLEGSMQIALRRWNSEEGQGCTFVVTTLACLQQRNSKFTWDGYSMLNQDSSNEFLVFWCMDTDGLRLDMKHLNHASSLNVTPLTPFFESSVEKSLRYHLPQNSKQRRSLMKSTNYVRSAFTKKSKASEHFLTTISDYEGTDHFFLLLSPNAEALQYKLEEESISTLTNALNRDYPEAPNGPKHGTELFLHMSLLSSKTNLSSISKAVFRNPSALVDHLISEKKLAITWDGGNIGLVHSYILANNGQSWEVTDLTSAGLYVNKGAKRLKKQMNKFVPLKKFPINKPTVAPQVKIEEMVSVFKWSTTLSSSYGRDKKDPCIVSAWTDDLNRCNGKTKIPMMKDDSEARQVDPDRAKRQRNLLLKYGENCYGGFQPCQRIVKNKLRCADHT